MASEAARLLDELMGRNRNVAPNAKGSELNWEDPEYCKLYMVKFCPHDLFVNTRADLGQCLKVHDDEIKSLFDKASSYKKQQYEDEFIRFCQSMLNEVARKIGKGKQRLSLIGKPDALSLSPAQTLKNEEQINFLTNKINSLVAEAEQMGIQGNVEQAQGLMKLCDQLKDDRELLKQPTVQETSHWQQVLTTAELAAAQEKQMEVCDVCGAFLIVGDAQQRIDDHLMGKQHVGYARLKMALEEAMEKRQKQRDDKDRKRDRTSRPRDEEDRGKRDRERDRAKEDRIREERTRDDRTKRGDRERSSRPNDLDPKRPRRSRSPKSGSSSRSRGSSSRRSDDRDRSYDQRGSGRRNDDRGHQRRDRDRGGLNGGSSSSNSSSARHHQESSRGGGLAAADD